MTRSDSDGWPRSFPEARALQERLRKRVQIKALRTRLRRIAGCDVSSDRASGRLFAAIVVLDFPSLEVREVATAVRREDFPYVPGYLSFREGPVLDRAFRKLKDRPDLVIVDGQGVAHPRRFGLACHLGVHWSIPAVGCAKSRLVGEAAEPGHRKGRWTLLGEGEEVLGSCLRTRDGVKPVFVSPGHAVDQVGARDIVLRATTRYRLPEPTRRAHREGNIVRRAWIARYGLDRKRGAESRGRKRR